MLRSAQEKKSSNRWLHLPLHILYIFTRNAIRAHYPLSLLCRNWFFSRFVWNAFSLRIHIAVLDIQMIIRLACFDVERLLYRSAHAVCVRCFLRLDFRRETRWLCTKWYIKKTGDLKDVWWWYEFCVLNFMVYFMARLGDETERCKNCGEASLGFIINALNQIF
jgi:hypothetical protein